MRDILRWVLRWFSSAPVVEVPAPVISESIDFAFTQTQAVEFAFSRDEAVAFAFTVSQTVDF